MRSIIVIFFLLQIGFLCKSQPLSSVLPKQNEIVYEDSVLFWWNKSEVSSQYQFQLSNEMSFNTLIKDTILDTNKFILKNILIGDTLYWRVKNTIGSWGNLNLFITFTPDNFQRLSLWLNADSADITAGKVIRWYDLSTSDYLINQPTEINQPTQNLNALNGKSALSFDGTNSYLNGGDILDLGTKNHTIFTVLKSNTISERYIISKSSGGGSSRWSIGNKYFLYEDDNARHLPFLMPQDNFFIGTYINNRVNNFNKVYFNGDSISQIAISGSYNMESAHNLIIGAYNSPSGGLPPLGYYFYGDIAEIIVYDTVFSDENRTLIEEYLNSKYSPRVNLGADINTLCPKLLDAGTGFQSYLWSTGQISQTITVNQTGYFWVKVRDQFGYYSTDTVYVDYLRPQNGISDYLICQFDTLELVSTVSDPSLTYQWENIDTYSTLSTNTTCSIDLPGNYSFVLTDENYCTYSDTFIVLLNYLPSEVSLGADSAMCLGQKLYLNEIIDTINISSIQWNTGSVLPYTYVNSGGAYSVEVINEIGCVGKDTVNISILGSAPVPIVNIEKLCFGDSTLFTDLSTPQGNIISWEWIINNLDTFHLQNFSYIFSESGNQNIKLFLNTSVGCSKDTSFAVYINNLPQVVFSNDPPCQGLALNFNSMVDIPSDGILDQYFWFIDNDFISNAPNLSYTFNSAGNYLIKLKVTLSNGCFNETEKAIEVRTQYPIANEFTAWAPSNNSNVPDENVTFNWNESGNSLNYELILASDSLFNNLITSITNIRSLSYETPINQNDTVFWRVKSYNPCGQYTETPVYKCFVFNPIQCPNVSLWLKSDSVDVIFGGVTRWYDQSQNSYSILQSSPSSQPIQALNAIYHYPSILFNGVNSYMDGGVGLNFGTNSNVVFYILKPKSSNEQYIVSKSIIDNVNSRWAIGNKFLLYQDNLPRHIPYSMPINKFFLGRFENNRVENINRIYFNQQFVVEDSILGSYNMDNAYHLLIGAYNNAVGGSPPSGSYFDGEIAEILVIDTLFSVYEIAQTEKYLMDKYAPPVNLGADIYSKLFCPISLEAGERFNDFYWSTGSTDSAISVNTSGLYWVRVTDIFGRVSSDTVEVLFPEVLKDTLFCANDSVTMNPDYTGLYSYEWSNSDTTWQTTINTGGTFWLEITDTAMCSRRDSFIVTVDSISFLASLGPDTTLCSGNPLSLQTGGDEAVSYSWWPGGQTAPEITVYNTGLYVLTVLSDNGCEAKDSIDVYIQGVAPIPGFTTQNLCFGDTIVFTDTSLSLDLSNVVSWEWTFPDATQMTGPVVEKALGAAGMYPVVLTITTDSSCSSVMTKQVQVFPLPEPQFVWTNPCTGLPLVFTNQSTISLGQVVDYFWILDDTDTSYIENPTFYPEAETEISVYMQATSNMGCLQDTSLSIYIKKSPVALFDISPSCSEKVTYFFDLSEATIIHPIMQWNWSLGIAGVTTQQQNPNYTYLSPGIYPVSLQVRSLNGCTSTYLKSVSVSANPIAGFSGMEVCEGLPLVISDTSTTVNGTIIQRLWEVDAMGTYNDSSISVLFPDSGDYAVELFVTSELYCTDSVRKIVRVHPLPMADFIMDKNFGSVPLLVQFDNESSNGTYLWAFGDGHSSTLTNPQHLYLNQGDYTVLMEVTDSNGCRQTSSNSVSVVSNLYDLVLFGMDTIIEGDIKKVVLYIANSGSLPVTNPLVLISAGQTMLYSETMNQTLQPGQIYTYTMASGTYLPNDNSGSYVCAKILLPQGQIDVNMTNNEFCLARENGLILLRVFPNPVSEELVIEFSSEKEMKGALQITNTTGKRVLNAEINMSKGFNRLLLNVSNYDQGMYFLNLSDQNSNIFYKFAKN